MHRDTQIGLVMAIVLIGFAAALCTPREPREPSSSLELPNAAELDARLARAQVRVYTEKRPSESTSETTSAAAEPAGLSLPETPAARDSVLNQPAAVVAEPATSPLPAPSPGKLLEPTAPEGPTLSQAAADVTARPLNEPAHRSTAPAWIVPPGMTTDPPRSEAASSLPTTHVVAPGDTLSGLALRYLGSVARFPEIYEANRDILHSPDDLKLGMVLRIPAHARLPANPAWDQAASGAPIGSVRE